VSTTATEAVETPSTATTQHTKILVIGGGYSGIGAAIRLRKSKIEDFTLIEKGDKLGGTWRVNTYPECGADTPSIIYSFSFARNPDWDYTFAKQPQIEKYLDDVADKYGVPQHAQFNTKAVAGHWDDEASHWVVETNKGTIIAKYVIACAGPQHEIDMPQIPGVESFEGEAFHSANWDHDVELEGKTVAIIGTGASAMQFLPEIQPKLGKMILFQRTAPWVMPRYDSETKLWQKKLFRRVPILNRALAQTIYLASEGLQYAQRHPKAMQQIQKLATKNLEKDVADLELRKQWTPNFTMGCKRILFSNRWYKALTAPNAEVVSLGVDSITPTGLIDSDGVERQADVIIYGTGFRVTDPDIAHRITGRAGITLSELWNGSPQAYYSTAVHGYPNAFIVLGPNVGNGHGSVSTLVELISDYIVKGIETAEAEGLASIEVKQHTQDVYNAEVQDALQGTVFNAGGCSSYYIDTNGRNSSIYPWTTLKFRRDTKQFKLADYETTKPKAAPQPAEKEAVSA
jgi:cation diffusion facilitator CzcD-associated flavoprotein CzcO